MSNRYKLTGCARFFIFLILFIPAVYFGLQIFAGDDHRVQEMKEWVNRTVDKAGESNTVEKILKKKEDNNAQKVNENSDLEEELELLKDQLARQEELILELKKELEALKE